MDVLPQGPAITQIRMMDLMNTILLDLCSSPPQARPCIDLGGSAANLSRQQDGRVKMLWVTVTGRVEALLPVAEVAEREPSIIRHFWPELLIFDNQHLHHHEVDGVFQAGVLVDPSSHSHQGQDVILQGQKCTGKQRVMSFGQETSGSQMHVMKASTLCSLEEATIGLPL